MSRSDEFSAGATASTGGQMTWGGYQWTIASNGIGQKTGDDSKVVPVVDGFAFITVAASQAAQVVLDYGSSAQVLSNSAGAVRPLRGNIRDLGAWLFH